MNEGLTYADAGVDIDAGNEFAREVKRLVAEAWPGTEYQIGKFAGMFEVLPGTTGGGLSLDGTGTKVLLALLMDQLDDIGQDLVAMAAVDLYMDGIRPTAVGDVISCEKLNVERAIRIIKSIIRACQLVGCRLVGGETAEVPGMYRASWVMDLNAAAVGFPDPAIFTAKPKPGDLVYGWSSQGSAGANGYSLLRRVFGLNDRPSRARERLQRVRKEFGGKTLGQVLLAPTPIWIPLMDKLSGQGVCFAGHAHITGGGLIDNPPRILSGYPDLMLRIDRSKWRRPAIFRVAQKLGKIDRAEMERTFNNGLMNVSIVSKAGLKNTGSELFFPIGEVMERRGDGPQVELIGDYKGE